MQSGTAAGRSAVVCTGSSAPRAEKGVQMARMQVVRQRAGLGGGTGLGRKRPAFPWGRVPSRSSIP